MPGRRLLVFLGVFSLFSLALVAGSAALAGADVLRVRGHVTLGWAGFVPVTLYVLFSLGWILRHRGS